VLRVKHTTVVVHHERLDACHHVSSEDNQLILGSKGRTFFLLFEHIFLSLQCSCSARIPPASSSGPDSKMEANLPQVPQKHWTRKEQEHHEGHFLGHPFIPNRLEGIGM
jgi:hypothetical protein